MSMSNDPLEFDEADVFDDEFEPDQRGGGRRNEVDNGDTASEASSADMQPISDAPVSSHISMESGGSHASLSLQVVLEEELLTEMPPEMKGSNIGLNSIMGSMTHMNIGRHRDMSASVPASRVVNMGTSAPIAIPFMGRWKPLDQSEQEARDGEEDDLTQKLLQYPGTFIPPHQLSQKDENMFSWTGQQSLKKDRLKARNQILMSTGFLEAGVKNINPMGIQERAKITPAIGGLSQAIGPRKSREHSHIPPHL
jgi:hypothetical protein